MTLLQFGVLTAIIVSVARVLLMRKVILCEHTGHMPKWGTVAACILFAICIRFFLVMLLLRTEYVAFEGDEVNRWALAHQWALSPFFFSGWDGIWLSGNFAYYGTLMWFFESPLVALQVGNCMAQVVGIVGLAHAGYVIGGSRICAIVTALLAAVGYPWILMGVGALSELLTSSLIVPAFTFTLQFLLLPAGQTRDRMTCAVLGSLCLFGVASHHFIGWFAILTGLPAFLFAVLYARANFGPWGYAGVVLLLLGAGAFPVGWLIGSWHYLGSPFAFLANQDKANAIYMQYEPKLDFPPFLLYPKLYWKHAALLVFPALASMVLPFASTHFRKRVCLLSFAFVFLFLFSLRAQTSGYYAVRERYVALFYALTFPLAGAAIGDLLHVCSIPQTSRRFIRSFVAGTVALFAVAWPAFNVNMTYRFSEYDNSGGWPNDALAVGYWLKRELTRHQLLTPDEAIGPIGIHLWNSDGNLRDFVAYIADGPDEIRAVPSELWPGKVPAEFRILITNATDDSPDFHQISAIGQWRVMRRQ